MVEAMASIASTISSLFSRQEENYDPHAHRSTVKTTTFFESLMHMLKASIGTGLLAIPQAFSASGMVTSTIGTVIIGTIITHCLSLIIKNQYTVCKNKKVPLMSYPESFKQALDMGPKCCQNCSCSKGLVDLFNVTFQLGICCAYIVFMASTVKKLIDPIYTWHVILHMLIFVVPLTIGNCIRSLKFLAPFSTLANVCILIAVGVIFVLLLTAKKLPGKVDYWGTINTLPLFFGTMMFSLTAVGTVIAIENNMKHPKDFRKPFGVLNVAMTIVVALYICMGILGQQYCRSSCKDVITLDLDESTIVVKIVLSVYVVVIFISYILQCYVPIQIIWNTYLRPCLEKKGCQNLMLWELVVRVLITWFTFGVAMALPMLGLIISLTGALCLSALGLIFPSIMEICIRYTTNYGPFKIILIKDIFILIFGLCGMFVGSFFAIMGMVERYQKQGFQ